MTDTGADYVCRVEDASGQLARGIDVLVNEVVSATLPDTEPNQTVSLHVAELAADNRTLCKLCHWFGEGFCWFLSWAVERGHCRNMFTDKPSPPSVYFRAGLWFFFFLVVVPFLIWAAINHALAQPVQQNGHVTRGHVAAWTTNGIIQDGGTATLGTINSLGLYGQGGTPFCITSSPTPAPFSGHFWQECMGVSPTTGALLSLNGPTALPLSWSINGSPILSATTNGMTMGSPTGGPMGPGTLNAQGLYVNGAAIGPGSDASNNTVTANGVTRTLANWAGYWPNGGGSVATFDVNAVPSGVCDQDSITTAFGCSFANTNSPTSFTIGTGMTYGQPATAYTINLGAAAHFTYVLNEGGWNQSTTGNGGRTGGLAYHTKVDNFGQGDLTAYSCAGFVQGAKLGATNFLANPAVSCFGGTVVAGEAGTYLNPYEVSLEDDGFDVAAVGEVQNLQRTVNTGALDAFWAGSRIQSIGTKPIDAAYSIAGLTNILLDGTTAVLGTNQSAIVLPANARLYLNGTNTDPDGSPALTSPGNVWLNYSSGTQDVTFGNGATNLMTLDMTGALTTTGNLVAPILATGSTTPRTTSARAADVINVKDYGAVLNGTTNDTPAFQNVYNLLPSGGTAYIPRGGWNTGTLTETPSKSVFWQELGPVDFGTSAPGTNPVIEIGDGDVTAGFYGGRYNFAKQIINSTNGFATVDISVNNKSGSQIPVGNVVTALNITGNSNPGNSGFTWPLNVNLNAGATGGGNTQDVAIASSVRRTGADATWQYFGQTIDSTGVAPNSGSADVGTEQDISANGPEVSSTVSTPGNGARDFHHYVAGPYNPPAWVAGATHKVADVITPGNGYTYVATVAGVSGSTAPTWPTTTGTVVDGGVTWSFGTTINMQVSRFLDLGGSVPVFFTGNILGAAVTVTAVTGGTLTVNSLTPGQMIFGPGVASGTMVTGVGTVSGSNVVFPLSVAQTVANEAMSATSAEIGAGINTNATYYDAIEDYTHAVLVGTSSAAIRLGPNMPIDFSGDGTLAGQNKRTLEYNSTAAALQYKVNGIVPLSISDTGQITGTAFGTAIGDILGPLQSGAGGYPEIALSNRLQIQRTNPQPTDQIDFWVRRSSSFTGGAGDTNSAAYFDDTVGANDASSNNDIIDVLNTNGTGDAVSGYFQTNRLTGSTASSWALIADMRDQTDTASSAGGGVTSSEEFDYRTNKADDAVNPDFFGGRGIRGPLGLIFSRFNTTDTTPAELSYGFWVHSNTQGGTGADPDAFIDSVFGIGVNTQIRSMLDSRGAIPPTGATSPVATVVMSPGQIIDFDGGTSLSSAPGRTLSFNSSVGLQYSNVTTPLFSIADSGATSITMQNAGAGIGLSIKGNAATGFDTSSATLTGPAYRMAAGQVFDWEITGVVTETYTSGSNGKLTTKNGTTTMSTLDQSGNFAAGSTVNTGKYTVATLPTCNAAAQGERAFVTDATAPSFLGALTGGGAVVAPTFCNGTAWVAG